VLDLSCTLLHMEAGLLLCFFCVLLLHITVLLLHATVLLLQSSCDDCSFALQACTF